MCPSTISAAQAVAAIKACKFAAASSLINGLPEGSERDRPAELLNKELALLKDFSRAETAYRTNAFADAERLWARVRDNSVCQNNARAADLLP